MIELIEITEALKRSNLELAEELLCKIKQEDWLLEREFSESPTACSELYKTYFIRNKNMASRKSEHAVKLHASTTEFVNNLKENLNKSCYLNQLTGPEEYDYFIAYEPENKQMLGLMKTYSQLKVSEERWQEIWSAP